ncbi:hypothetical protein MTYM_01417 [Methylococcales bacterium]|nr:hypothetical protein MTYM_01417 [Methylococcales bacterium]
MSFYIRKSVKLGPLRLNFSKSGIGISAGVKGARISTGPRGTYIHMGGNGIYYRKRIDGSIPEIPPKSKSKFEVNRNLKDVDGTIHSANVEALIESSNEDLLGQLNSRIQQPTYAFWVGLVSTLLAGGIASLSNLVKTNASVFSEDVYPIFVVVPLLVGLVVWIAGLFVTYVTNQQETLARTTTLNYELDDGVGEKFTTLQDSIDRLSKSARIWRVVSKVPTYDWKRNAGALSSITRRTISVRNLHPPFIQTNIPVYGMLLGAMQIYFFPDQILVFQNGKYGAVSCESLNASVSVTNFVEEEWVPNDSTIAYYTWRYVRRDGGPDRRFNNNRQIPVVQYGHLELSSSSGLNIYLHISSLSNAQNFVESISDYSLYRQQIKPAAFKLNQLSEQQEDHSEVEQNPYTVLRVSQNSSKDEVVVAYNKLMQMYHPDKIARYPLETQLRAKNRIAAIQSAYEQLVSNSSEIT